jgi:hypothetical protein
MLDKATKDGWSYRLAFPEVSLKPPLEVSIKIRHIMVKPIRTLVLLTILGLASSAFAGRKSLNPGSGTDTTREEKEEGGGTVTTLIPTQVTTTAIGRTGCHIVEPLVLPQAFLHASLKLPIDSSGQC